MSNAIGTNRFITDEFLSEMRKKRVTILGHDGIDIDAALSGILLSKLFDFLKITNQFFIWEEIDEKSDTYKVIKDLIGIDLKEYERASEDEFEYRNLFLVDHFYANHCGQVLGYIDHHPTMYKNDIPIPFIYSRKCSATAYLIYELMKETQYPLEKHDVLMIITAMMADTVCFKSTKARKDEREIARKLADEYNLNWEEIEKQCLCLTYIDKMSKDEIINNGWKSYCYDTANVGASYIQVYGMPDKKLVEDLLNTINRGFKGSMYVFLIFDLKDNLTYEYQFDHWSTKEIIHKGIISRGQDVMPRIERKFLQAIKLEEKISRIILKLSEENKTIATMESCTGGQLASEITNISGASDILKESYITYSNEAKIKLGVSEKVIEEFSVYSAETAVEMANSVCKLANSDIGVGITGQLGRVDPNNPGANDNEVWYAIKFKGQDSCVERKLTIGTIISTRAAKKKVVVNAIIDTLYELICV